MIETPQLPVIETERLRLRMLTDKDVPGIFEIFSDPEVMRYWSSEPMTRVDDAAQLLGEIRSGFNSRTLFEWGVAQREDDAVIGTCTLFHIDLRNRRAEIGYALRSSHWGRGLMVEAVGALINFAFDTLVLHRLEADVDPGNAASLGLLEKLGFEREGHSRERWIIAGKAYDSILLGLLRRDWNSARAVRNEP